MDVNSKMSATTTIGMNPTYKWKPTLSQFKSSLYYSMLFIEKLNVEQPLKMSYTNMTEQVNVNEPKYVPHPHDAERAKLKMTD